jgi:hypothetical protein
LGKSFWEVEVVAAFVRRQAGDNSVLLHEHAQGPPGPLLGIGDAAQVGQNFAKPTPANNLGLWMVEV